MFIINITQGRPSDNYPIKIVGIFSAMTFHIYPTSISYSQNGISWHSIDIKKGETVRIISTDTGETLESYTRK